MKGILIFLLCLVTTFVQGQFTLIPDANFEQVLVAKNYDNAIDGKVLTANIENVEMLFLQNKSIRSLAGIADFRSLERLYVGHNNLQKIDVSNNVMLTELHCVDNEIKVLDVSKNVNLTDLYFFENQISTIDLSKNTSLEFLNCHDNNLSSLDVSNNTGLIFLDCNSNKLTNLDVSKNIALNNLHFWNNPIKSIDVTKNTQLLGITASGTLISSLDLSKNSKLGMLNCTSTQLKRLDVSDNSKLKNLWCSNNYRLTCLNLKNNQIGSGFFLDARNCNEMSCIEVDAAYVSTAGSNPKILVSKPGLFSANCYTSCQTIPDSLAPSVFNVYPNPLSSGRLSIDLGVEQQNVSIEVKNQYGLVVKQYNLGTGTLFSLDFDIAPGIYMLEVTYGAGIKMVKRVIKAANNY